MTTHLLLSIYYIQTWMTVMAQRPFSNSLLPFNGFWSSIILVISQCKTRLFNPIEFLNEFTQVNDLNDLEAL